MIGLLVIIACITVYMFIRNQDLGAQLYHLQVRLDEMERQLQRLLGKQTPVPPPPATQPIFPEPAAPKTVPSPVFISKPMPKVFPAPAAISRQEATPAWTMPVVDWENFMGVKLFAWLGGFALFLGMAFFVKFSIDHGWITPLMRVMAGFVVGVGAILGGLALRGRKLDVTVQTLCAAGVAILYTDVFACRSFYNFITPEVAFPLMTLVTVVAFLLAVRLDARYIAIMGWLGGFLTPILLHTGIDRPLGHFSYIALLDAGLIAIALRQRWGFLMSLSVGATFFMQARWALGFFTPAKAELAVGIYLAFCLLYLLAQALASRQNIRDKQFLMPAALLPLLCMVFVAQMLGLNSLAARPGLVLSFLFALSAQLAYLAVRREDSRSVYMLGGLVTFLLLVVWTVGHLKAATLMWGLGYYMAFAVLHALLPILLARLRPTQSPFTWGYAAPLMMLGLILVAMLACDILSFAMWPFILLLGMMAIAVAWIAASMAAALATLVLIMSAFGIWLFRLPDVAGLPGILTILAFFACGFFAWSLLITRGRSLFKGNAYLSLAKGISAEEAALLPAFSAFMPFMLIALVCVKLVMPNPTDVFALMMLMTILMLGLVRYRSIEMLPWVTLFSVGAVEWVWHWRSFTPAQAGAPLAWYLAFYAIFLLFPFMNRKHLKGISAWSAAAFAGPIQFWFIYQLTTETLGKHGIGLLPALFAVPPLLGLAAIQHAMPKTDDRRVSLLAWFGGVALFFITLVIPVQFDKEWITLGWALEGAALLWLYQRVPHEGLKAWALALLGIAFVRLTFNPAVFSYHPRTAVAIFNWYLLVYGATAASLFAAARLLEPPRHLFMESDTRPVLNSLGAVLLFLLLNIEIADYFSQGSTITFHFSGNFAQDMTYSLAWGLFAIVMLLIGIRNQNRGTRYASLALLTLTILKVFMHDLWRLGQLFRVASFIGLAVVLILVSFLYQRYVSADKSSEVKRA